jgi:hypothetical protein
VTGPGGTSAPGSYSGFHTRARATRRLHSRQLPPSFPIAPSYELARLTVLRSNRTRASIDETACRTSRWRSCRRRGLLEEWRSVDRRIHRRGNVKPNRRRRSRRVERVRHASLTLGGHRRIFPKSYAKRRRGMSSVSGFPGQAHRVSAWGLWSSLVWRTERSKETRILMDIPGLNATTGRKGHSA